MLDVEFEVEKAGEDMPSLNHSYICSQILRQLFSYDFIEVLSELTLDIDNGLTPDICVYPSHCIHPNFSRDVTRLKQMPILAIEVISGTQNIQSILEKAERLLKAGVPAIWSVEPYTRSVFVTTENGECLLHAQEMESAGIKVDFKKIFESGEGS